MAKFLEGKGKILLLLLLVSGTLGFFGVKVNPEMKEVINNFPNRAQREIVLQKFAEPGVVPKELTLCDMTKPVVTKSTDKEGITY